MKLKIFCTAKNTRIQTKQQPTEWEYISDRGYMEQNLINYICD